MYSLSPEDEAAIRSLMSRMYEAWSRNDAAAYAACFENDSDYVSFDGTHLRGRAQNEASHRLLFDTVLEGTRLLGEIEEMRALTPDVAIVHASGSVVWPWHAQVPRGRVSRQTMVFVKRAGVWSGAAFQNTRVRPVPPITRDSFVVRCFRIWCWVRRTLAQRRVRTA